MIFFTNTTNSVSTKLKHYIILIWCLMGTVVASGQLTEIEFSVERGFYDNPFTVELIADDPSAIIRYTTNNTKPTTSSGTIYSGPINISSTTSIRAIAYTGAGAIPVETHTYIFLDDIITASYMETNITNSATYGPQMRDALLAIPTISLVSSDVSSNNSIDVEVETSVEMFFPDGRSAFQVHSGIQTWGGSPTNLKKHYRLEFKTIYGTPKLKYPVFDNDGYDYPIPAVNEFNKLLLRGGSQDGLNCEYCDESQAQYIRNRFIWDVQMEMGYPAPHGRYVHVYVNGEYMGQYHLMERPDEAWFESYYFPEKLREQIEVRKSGEYWNQPVSPTFYDQMVSAGYNEDYIDKQQAADYTILNDYGANFDWGTSHNNLGGADPIPGNGGYKFVVWDFDLTLGNVGVFGSSYGPLVNHNSLGNTGPIPGSVNSDSEFKIMEGDRLECHCFNDGVLTPAVLDEMYMRRANQVQLPLIAESARWGNKSFSFSSHTPKSNWDVNDEWITERQDVRNNYLPYRTNNLVNYYRNAGRYPSTQSVQFSQFGGEVNSGYQLTLSNPNGNGTIYYTTNGTDPRLEGGGISPSAQVYSGPITITGPVEIQARVRISSSTWSAMCPRRFYVAQDRSTLVINEIHYHADSLCRNFDWNETEYLEIKNTGNTTLNMTDCRLSSGVTYTFPWNATIGPGQIIVLAENSLIFQQEFGFAPYDQYKGDLSNDGETLILVDYKNEVLDSVQWNDQNPWDEMPDGVGPSLELRHPSLDNADPLNWFRSDVACAGTPGYENSRLCDSPATPVVINEINYNSNNGVTDPGDWVELYNPNNTPVDISNWEFYDNGNQFIIPAGTVIQPDEYLVLVESAAMFTSIFPQVANYVGDFAFNLSKKGERVSIFDTNKCLSDYVVYNDKFPWPIEPDGLGPTLSLINPYNGLDNNIATSWESSSAINSAYGTPGRINVPCKESEIVPPPLVCPNISTTFNVDVAYPDVDYTWFVQGATPSTGTGSSISVTWANPGTYTVQLANKYFECTSIKTFSVTINCTVSDTYITPEDISLNDAVSNAPGGSVSTIVSSTTNGTLTFNPDGTFNYVPDPDFSGTDNFIFETCEDIPEPDTTIYSSVKNYSGQVITGSDDVEEASGTGLINTGSGDLDLLVDGASIFAAVGVRISNVNVPSDAVITKAYLQFVADEAQSGTTNVTIAAEDVGNAAALTSTAYSITSKTQTSASVAWNPLPWTIGGTYQSADISTVIQELIDRGDWSSGNAMTFVLEGTGTRTAESYEGGVNVAPKLFIDYETVDSIVISQVNTPTCIPSLVEIEVTPVNDPPIAANDSYTTNEDTPVSGNVQSNDSDVEDATLNSTITTQPTNGTVSLSASGAYTYTPNLNFSGTDSFQYEICDSGSPVFCETATVTITVNAVNDAPILNNDSAVVVEDGTWSGNVSTNDSDLEGGLIYSTTLATPPSNGTVIINSDGTYTYTPNADFNGTDSFEYEACDNGSPVICETATVTITVTPVNDAPTVLSDNVSVAEDVTLNGDISLNDSDPEGALTYNTTPLTPPANGTLTLNSDGTYTYTPNADFNGTDSFEYEACDNGSPALCETAIVTITVNPVNDAPVLNNDAIVITEDASWSGDVSSNDSDLEGTLAYNTSPTTPPSNGTVIINSDGTYTYTPNADFNGTDSFVYEACDNGSPVICEMATVSITVSPAPDAPIAVNDNLTTNEESSVSFNIIQNDIEPDGESLVLNTNFITPPANGSAFAIGSGFLSYTPDLNFNGIDTIEYQVCDNAIPPLCDIAMVIINVNPQPDPPVAVDDVAGVQENTTFNGDVLANDYDPDGDDMAVTLPPLASPSFGNLVLNADGTYAYTPNPGYFGSDSFEYEVCEVTAGNVNSYQESISSGANDIEERTSNGTISTSDAALDMVIKGNTTYTTGLRWTNLTIPPGATITNAYITLTANASTSDASTLNIGAIDIGNLTAFSTANYSLTNLPRTTSVATWSNVPAWTVGATYNTPDLSAVVQEVVDRNDWGAGNAIAFVIDGSGTRRATSFEGGAPPELFIEYELYLCDTAVVTITVDNINDAPNAVDDVVTIPEDGAANGDLLANDSDIENNAITINTTPLVSPANGSLVINPDGTYTYTPNPNYFGTDSFEYEICDDGTPSECATAVVSITIDSVNDAPTAMSDTLYMFANSTLQDNIILNDSDIENHNLTAMTTPMAVPLNGTLSIQSNGNIDYTPNPNYIGTETFTYEVCDDGNPIACSTAEVVIIIEPDCIDIQIAVWMEGPFDPTMSEMSNALNLTRGLLPGQTPVSGLATPTPAGQPYNRAPWNYTGTEGAGWTDADYTADVVDWLLVSFRTDIAVNTQVAKTAALLHKDGTISFPDRCVLDGGMGLDSVYVVVEHRNHMGVMSPQLVPVVNATLTYDFRIGDSYRDITSFGQKQLPTGEWCMYTGDGNQTADAVSYDINGQDKSIWVDDNGIFDNYLDTDFNLNGDVNGADKSLWFENNGISSRVPK